MLRIKAEELEKELILDVIDECLTINNEAKNVDLIKESETRYHLIKDNRSYNLELLESNVATKEFTIKVNGNEYKLKAQDKYDELLSKMGISRGAVAKVNELKAPMPGLVLQVMVEVGQEVKQDEPLLILEAMKMENVLKSPADVVIKSIEISTQDAVEKNQILLKFD